MSAIVLEGRDEAGKTTLANQLGRVLGVPVRKSPAGKGQWQPVYGAWTEQYGLVNPMFILDRSPEISEMVYGTLRGTPRMANSFTEQVRLWRQRNIFLVFCMPPLTRLQTVHRDAEENFIDFPWVSQIQDGYNQMLNLIRLDATVTFRVSTYDYHAPYAWERLSEEIEDWRMVI